MKEEEVTERILRFLRENSFSIFSYDFPQSGTGYVIRPNQDDVTSSHKNLNIWIPDIIAFKGESLLFFENKNYYSQGDIQKLKEIKSENYYSDKIESLLSKTGTKEHFILLGYPLSSLSQEVLPPWIDGEFRVDDLNDKIEVLINNPRLSENFSN